MNTSNTSTRRNAALSGLNRNANSYSPKQNVSVPSVATASNAPVATASNAPLLGGKRRVKKRNALKNRNGTKKVRVKRRKGTKKRSFLGFSW